MSEDFVPEPGDPTASIDAAFAEVVADVREQMAEVAKVAQAEHDADEDEHECTHEWEPDHKAMATAVDHLEDIMQAAECHEDREASADCDHVVAGEECPFPAPVAEAMEHTLGCPRCLASTVMADVWPYAVAQEAADVVKHLMVLRTDAMMADDSEGVAALSLAIDNIANGRHR